MSDATPTTAAPATPDAAPQNPAGAPPDASTSPTEGTPPVVETTRTERIDGAIAKSREAAEKRRQDKQRLEAAERRAAHYEQSHTQTQRELADARAFRERMQRDPLAAVRELGVDATTLATKALKEGTPDAKLEALEARIAEYEREKKETTAREHTAKQRAQLKSAEQALITTSRDVSKYPALAGQPPRAVLALAKDVISEALEATGSVYSDAEVLQFLEDHWSGYQKKRAAEVTSTLPNQPGADPQPKSAAPRTLSQATPPKNSPVIEEIDPSLPEHEQRRQLVEIFERKQKESRR